FRRGWIGARGHFDGFGRFKFLAFARRFTGAFGFKLGAGLGDGLADGGHDRADGADGVVVRGDRVVDEIGIAIGIDEGDDRDAEFARFGDGVVFAFDVDDEHGGGMFIHAADAFEIFIQAGLFAADDGLFLFDVVIDG